MCALVTINYQNDFVPGPLGSKAAAEIEDALYAHCMEYGGDLIVFTRDTLLDLYPKAKISVDRRRVTSYDSALGEAALGVMGLFCIDASR